MTEQLKSTWTSPEFRTFSGPAERVRAEFRGPPVPGNVALIEEAIRAWGWRSDVTILHYSIFHDPDPLNTTFLMDRYRIVVLAHGSPAIIPWIILLGVVAAIGLTTLSWFKEDVVLGIQKAAEQAGATIAAPIAGALKGATAGVAAGVENIGDSIRNALGDVGKGLLIPVVAIVALFAANKFLR